jgi:chromosome segregation ATPase
VTAVWFGVMVGLNIQTSFLTPPFGFSLFYLRGVAPKDVRTTQIYKGAAAFIVLQLLGLAIAGAFPSLINYLPNKTHLVSDTAPPPNNPKLQECLEQYLFNEYDNNQAMIQNHIERMRSVDLSYLPDEYQEKLNESYKSAARTFDLVAAVRDAELKLEEYAPRYRPIHERVRQIQKSAHKLGDKISELDQDRQRIAFGENVDQARIEAIQALIKQRESERKSLLASIPDSWESAHAQFEALAKAEKIARLKYRQNADDSYDIIATLKKMLAQTDALIALQARVEPLIDRVRQQSADQGLDAVDSFQDEIDKLAETFRITSKLSRAKRALRGDTPEPEQAIAEIRQAAEILQSEIDWRQRARSSLANELRDYDQAINTTIGARLQPRLTSDQAGYIASCLAVHRDVSLYF